MVKLILCAVSLFSQSLVTSCKSPSYSYQVVVFDKSPGTIVAEGAGKAKSCQTLFEPPGVYLGRDIDILPDASIFGVLVVMRQGKSKLIPLYTWNDKAGAKKYGCHGPSPQFAHRSGSQEDLVKSISTHLGE